MIKLFKVLALSGAAVLPAAAHCAEDAQLERAKVELLVEQAGELLADANRKGSSTHTPACQLYFGMIYGAGTNLLARTESTKTAQLMKQYKKLIERDYDAYTRVENAMSMAAATGNDHKRHGRHVVNNGSRHRAKRIANAEKLGDKELASASKKWEAFVIQLKKTK